MKRWPIVLLLSVVLCACSRPTAVAWDRDDDALVLRYWGPDRSAGAWRPESLIPPLQIWGDGRVIWLSGGTPYADRVMMEGYLDGGQMQALAARISDAGFFTWNETYLDPAPVPGHTLAVALPGHDAEEVKQVFVNAGAPPGFDELIRYLLDGVPAQAAEVRPYVPAEAWVVASGPVPEAAPDPDIEWPDAAPDLVSAAAGSVVTVDGVSLAFLWKLVNQSPRVPHALPYDGEVYFVTLAVPNVSLCTGDVDPAFEIRWSCG